MEYEERLRRSQYMPRLSYGRWMLVDDGCPHRFFLMYLTAPRDVAPVLPALIRHLRYEVRPRSLLIIFRLQFWAIFCFIAWRHTSQPYYNSFRTSCALTCRRAKIVGIGSFQLGHNTSSHCHGNNDLAGSSCGGSNLGVRIVQSLPHKDSLYVSRRNRWQTK